MNATSRRARAHRSPPADLSLHGLLALEAVGRLGSVQGAADELHVTPSGVSHRIASLQRKLGAPLLRRTGRGVTLTEVAQQCVDAMRPALTRLADATAAVVAQEATTIRIAAGTAADAAWAVPHIVAYSAMQPDTRFDVRVLAATHAIPQDPWDVLVHRDRARARGVVRAVLGAGGHADLSDSGRRKRRAVHFHAWLVDAARASPPGRS